MECLKRNGKATYGGLSRESRAIWKGGISKNIVPCNNFSSELWGVFQGLQFAWNKGDKKIEIQTDNKKIT